MKGEDRLLRWLRGRLAEPLIGHDAAVVPPDSYAVTVDSQIEGIHFVPGLDPGLLARRLLAVNLSDLAATGARPAYAFLALSTVPSFDHEKFFRALLAACGTYGLQLAGGDLARSPHGTVATLTLLGTKPEGARWLRRSGAAAGHGIWLGGAVGESAAGRLLIRRGAHLVGARVELPASLGGPAGLRAAARRAVRRHLLPEPQLELGAWLAEQRQDTRITGIAAIDVSDGLARDLHRLCRESSAGAEISAAALPLANGFVPLCAVLGAKPSPLALGGGEDYVLLFTLPSGLSPPARFACRRIGTITRNRRIRMVQDGVSRDLPELGWDHLERSANESPGSLEPGPE